MGRGVSEPIWQKSDWPIVGVCLTLSGFGLSAVPFIGTKYGDWPEAMALGVGLLPLIYVAISMGFRFAMRLSGYRRAPPEAGSQQNTAGQTSVRPRFDLRDIGVRQTEVMADFVHEDVRDHGAQ